MFIHFILNIIIVLLGSRVVVGTIFILRLFINVLMHNEYVESNLVYIYIEHLSCELFDMSTSGSVL